MTSYDCRHIERLSINLFEIILDIVKDTPTVCAMESSGINDYRWYIAANNRQEGWFSWHLPDEGFEMEVVRMQLRWLDEIAFESGRGLELDPNFILVQ